MCQYFSKTEGQYSQATKRAAKEAFENNMHHHDTMKTIAKPIESVSYFVKIDDKDKLYDCLLC